MSVPGMEKILKDKTFNVLNQEQVESFMKYGFLRLPGAIPLENCDRWAQDIWNRLGMDPNDKSTWSIERCNMAKIDVIPAKDIAPIAWAAICELCGGEDRIAKGGEMWTDGFIVNLGSDETEGKTIPPKDLKEWHVDGDFFIHFLDSPEQALLVIPCWSDVEENAGATWICDEGPTRIGKYLLDHPEGVGPTMNARDKAMSTNLGYYNSVVQDAPDETFHEMTGKRGDVILMHPLMLHSASKNGRRLARIITNPPVSLAAPFQFDRSNPDEYSLVELKTIQDVGGFDKVKGWKITGERERFVPERVHRQTKVQEAELARLHKLGIVKEVKATSQMPWLMVADP